MFEYNKLLNDIIFGQIGNFNSLNLFLFIISALLFSLAIDVIFGELPAKVHPVVIIGSVIGFFKRMFIGIKNRLSGFLLVLFTCIVSSVILYVIYRIASVNVILLFIVFSLILSSTFSVKMLLKTAIDVKYALDENIDKARDLVSYLVSRNTSDLTESFIVSAAIESLTENITDSFVAPVFYYFIFTLAILLFDFNSPLFILLLVVVLYRTFNTLDAMVGYETDELANIGFIPAKIDDIVNYIPSRIAGVYVVVSAYLLRFDGKNAFKIMMRDARKCPSPNSGYTMATAAGALDIQLVKKGTYILGDENKSIDRQDIQKAVSLTKLTIILFTLTVVILLVLFQVII